MWGLSQTEDFEVELGQRKRQIRATPAGADHPLIYNAVRYSPFPNYDRPLLYPFLIAGAICERSPDSFSDIETQMAFPLRTLLKLQQDLQIISRQDDDVGPLVWFIAYRGSDWRLYAAVTGRDHDYARLIQALSLESRWLTTL